MNVGAIKNPVLAISAFPSRGKLVAMVRVNRLPSDRREPEIRSKSDGYQDSFTGAVRSSVIGGEAAIDSALGRWELFLSVCLARNRAARKSSSRRREMSLLSLMASDPFTMQSQVYPPYW